MPRIVFPAGDQPTRALPFNRLGVVFEKPATIVVDGLPCAVWPARTRVEGSGAYADHEGEAPLAYLPQLAVPNRVLQVDGVRYTIVEATAHEFLPHVAMRLRRADGSAV